MIQSSLSKIAFDRSSTWFQTSLTKPTYLSSISQSLENKYINTYTYLNVMYDTFYRDKVYSQTFIKGKA